MQEIIAENTDTNWVAPSLYTDAITLGKQRELIIYGEDLIAHTAKYFGPKGSIDTITNGMNCQNCHLDGGTRPWGSNFGAVYATYPQFKARSNSIQGIFGRVNDCFERSLNGKPIDTNGKEMQAIFAYIKWLGGDVPKGTKPIGSGIKPLSFLSRPADPKKGEIIYNSYCQSCHGSRGEGQLNFSKTEFTYPPLWGNHSYNDGAGLYRISSFAFFVKNNMPFNQATHADPKLSDEQAWDVAAFVNSQPRPHKDQSQDWKNISNKPFDYPQGPFSDSFREAQHKYGPFGPIVAANKNLNKKIH
ncbi:MAG: c-type cytochrome [Flavisolibacter sp.]